MPSAAFLLPAGRASAANPCGAVVCSLKYWRVSDIHLKEASHWAVQRALLGSRGRCWLLSGNVGRCAKHILSPREPCVPGFALFMTPL